MIVIDFFRPPPLGWFTIAASGYGTALALDSKFIVAFRLITPRLE